MSPVRIGRSVEIPDDEIELSFSTSSGPGGQHVNKSETRVSLTWDVRASRALGPRQRERVLKHLANRIDSSGRLHLSSSRFRSQLRNREDVIARLSDLVADAIRPPKRRVETRPTSASREKRLRAKRKRSEIKRARGAVRKDLQ
jgi:ribosome-associated protein